MKNNQFLVVLIIVLFAFLSGCSMMPDDEDIIKGSILESEILDDEELMIDNQEGDDGEELIRNDEELIRNDEELIRNDEELDTNMVDDDEDSEIQFEFVE